ncbi:MAG: hypothetical protein UV37_C0002G0008 [Candidatus Collierbacteria bacterium GW2011_GWA1_42_60]|uniref:Uncharacterized protein n=1 Tax=Candidatus Collierbacteria bacterium GW2011_GWA2_42_17 TaxID=1618378 RepID=A0A0G0Z2B3_9BACT|nr:MAG: hypothetical protein UU94_C0002G0072 [Candidatus Collierbacteria bacterium GW2011_GWB2_42_12]KKS42930.1 MAG: hypothetical protein UV06_C0004G0065 [Candidatus Collierbacteria bacterium GW2011_GWA2_42_17]KKS62232.1 MAG: hypothetical protein UV28_C0014G0003 [Candidatus Collierbacteria bacterium GW2011_GWE2_42_48]KKS62672.1 MAG: hypothetical protein UV30_C0012G0003 [Candidatus Collierbacteria bacterium GW2011_GWF1_42_50]KKS67704.1 MAG: hypothetical protein UV37_C0002G0008 [Candidatus Collie
MAGNKIGGENMRSKDKLAVGKALIYFSIVSVILAFIGALGTDLWLASTQWMLVGLTAAIWGVFVLIEAEFRMKK